LAKFAENWRNSPKIGEIRQLSPYVTLTPRVESMNLHLCQNVSGQFLC
jgi:hypothetical protein